MMFSWINTLSAFAVQMNSSPRRSLSSVSVWCTCTVYASHPHVVTSSSINVEASECRSYKAVSFPAHFYTQSVVETDFQSRTCFSCDSHQKLLQTFSGVLSPLLSLSALSCSCLVSHVQEVSDCCGLSSSSSFVSRQELGNPSMRHGRGSDWLTLPWKSKIASE